MTASARLGHDPSVLLARYAHLRPGKDEAAADLLELTTTSGHGDPAPKHTIWHEER